MNDLFNEENKKKFDIKKLNEVLKLSSKILKIAYIFIVVIAIYALTLLMKEWKVVSFLLTLLKILTTFFIGIVIAWLLEPIVRYLKSKNMNRVLGTSLVYVVLIFLIYLIFNSMIPIFLGQVNDFIQSLPAILEDVVNWFNSIFDKLGSNDYINFDNIKTETIHSIEQMVSKIATDLPVNIVNMIKSVFSALGIFILGLLIGFYLLFDFNNAGPVIFNVIPKKYKTEVKSLLLEVNESLLGFVKGTLLTSTLVFIFSTLVFSLVGLKAPLLFGLICGITNIIPYIGPYIGAAPAMIVAFSQGTGMGIIVTILLLVIQTIEGNFVHPLVMSKTMKLHPVTILISLLVFEYYFGILGMIIATPVVAAIKILYAYFHKRYKLYKSKLEDKCEE